MFVIRWLKPVLPWLGRLMLVGLRFIPLLGWLVAGIELVYLAFKNWDKIKKWLSPLFDWLQEKFGMLFGWLNDLREGWNELWNGKDSPARVEKSTPPFSVSQDVYKTGVPGLSVTEDAFGDFGNYTAIPANDVYGMPSGTIPDFSIMEDGYGTDPWRGTPYDIHGGFAPGTDDAVLSREEADLIRGMTGYGQPQLSEIGEISIQITGDNHYSNEMDAEKVGRIAWEEIKRGLEEEYRTASKGVYGV